MIRSTTYPCSGANDKEDVMILFRADGNAEIGSGHIMRCLSIADAFERTGQTCAFALADSSLQPLIEKRGYVAHVFGTDYRRMGDEIDAMRRLIATNGASLVVVDSYYVTSDYLSRIKRSVPLAYLDDLALFPYPVDVLIDYNAYSPDIDYSGLYHAEGVKMPKFLLGVSYAPLRKMFRSLPQRRQKRRVKDVLISTGGADMLHLAKQIMTYIIQHPDNRRYHFLVGGMNPDYEDLCLLAKGKRQIIIHHDVQDMCSLILSCDLIVTAAGSTMYEIAACGVPMITYVLADNQIPGMAAFERLSIAMSCGDLRGQSNAAERILSAVATYAEDYPARERCGKKMQSLVDGYGADRMVTELLQLTRKIET